MDKYLRQRVPISEETRLALKTKRLKLGFSYNKLAECLGANWSSVRKWELGSTTFYSRFMEQKVKAFLSDNTIEIPELFEIIMDKIVKRQKAVFHLLLSDAVLRKKFLMELEGVIDKTLIEY